MLKERLIELLMAKPQIVDMSQPLTSVSWNITHYDLAGLILKVAGYSLQSGAEGPRLPLNAPLLDTKWFEFEFGAEIQALARQLWEAEYGEKEAKELPFYSSATRVGSYWWDDLDQVDHRHLIAFLRGPREDIYALNGPAGNDD